MDGPAYVQKQKTANKGQQQGEHQQIKYKPTQNYKGTYKVRRGE